MPHWSWPLFHSAVKAHLGLRVGLLVIRPQAADALLSILKGRLQTLHLLQAGASTRLGGFIIFSVGERRTSEHSKQE